MAENDFLPFATGSAANVLTQADYAALSALASGFTSGVAKSAAVNKVLRQSSIMAAVLAAFIADNAGVDVIDDGTTATIEANFLAALKAKLAALNGSASNTFAAKNAVAATDVVNLAQAQGLQGSVTGSFSTSQAGAISAAMFGSALYLYGSGGAALTLPALSSLASRALKVLSIYNGSTGDWTLATTGAGDGINVYPNGYTQSLTITKGSSLEIVIDPNAASFTAKSGTALAMLAPLPVGVATAATQALQRQQVGRITLTATSSFVVPPGITQIVFDGAAGGGGGGGGASGSSATGSGGGGGGAGQTAVRKVLTVVPGETLTVTVPAAGNGGAASANGGSGGNLTIVGSVSGNLLSLTGGTGGTSGVNLTGGSPGGQGGAGYPAGSYGNDTSSLASNSPSGNGGTGASNAFGGGGGSGRGASATGVAGSGAFGYGSGGGGGGGYYVSGTGTGGAGGIGAPGFAFIQW